jgi:hypothetical protein
MAWSARPTTEGGIVKPERVRRLLQLDDQLVLVELRRFSSLFACGG